MNEDSHFTWRGMVSKSIFRGDAVFRLEISNIDRFAEVGSNKGREEAAEDNVKGDSTIWPDEVDDEGTVKEESFPESDLRDTTSSKEIVRPSTDSI